ncbi:hypothetical protein K2173_021862 [Erythroxylum novogranatense]|uniref:DNA-binding protein BIN4 n=1 Tax=Erythroxylum novogranatense TaxID=1862640 RepID=A0AAV8T3C4_9ROSI|nr:hypothetical protein K2173_021862 [Erythroxylum novogranatense]
MDTQPDPSHETRAAVPSRMSSSREDSPDWLRCFQAPSHSTFTLSSDSESSPGGSYKRDKVDSPVPLEDKGHNVFHAKSSDPTLPNNSPKPKISRTRAEVDHIPSKKKKKKRDGDELDEQNAKKLTSNEHIESHVEKDSVWTLSSDSESGPGTDLIGENKESGKDEENVSAVPVGDSERSPLKNVSKMRSRKGNHGDVEAAKQETSEKHLCKSRLPLLLSEKVHCSKAVVECEGESIDLSGDMGAVGRVIIPDNTSGSCEMYLDLKGTIYRTTIVPSRTFCVVSFGQSEAKIEAIMDDFIQLKPQSNVYEAETMVEGTLEGFSFDSEEELDVIPKGSSHQSDQNEGIAVPTDGKSKGKAEKSSGVVQKKGKAKVGKPHSTKKAKKKGLVSKRAKTKK